MKHFETNLEGLLSKKLTRIVEESKTLLKLKADIGRLPKGKLQSDCISLIDNWFETALNSLMHLECPTIQPVVEAHSLAEPVLQPIGLLNEIHKEKAPTDDDIPF